MPPSHFANCFNAQMRIEFTSKRLVILLTMGIFLYGFGQ